MCYNSVRRKPIHI